MSRFRPAGFRNGRPAWRRASRPDSGRPARRRSTAFRDGWTASRRRASRNPAAPRNAVSPGEAGAAERRFTMGGSGKSVARCHRTVLAYWKFESISLQQTVRLSPDFAFVSRKVPVFRQFREATVWQGRQRRAQPGNIEPKNASVSVGLYSSTAVLSDAVRGIDRRRPQAKSVALGLAL